ncbi:hypothetical protein C1A50_4200 [Paenibacillus polymyxa]|nr:hypothetical protein C1A50_4200 [Paenibacillus polymyxa]
MKSSKLSYNIMVKHHVLDTGTIYGSTHISAKPITFTDRKGV